MVDEYRQKYNGGFQKEIQRRLEVKNKDRDGGDDHSRNLCCQDMKHVVSELQDESHREPQEGSDKNKGHGESIVSIEEATILYATPVFWAQTQHQAIEHGSEEVQLGVLHKNVFTELASFLQDLFIVNVG